MKKDELIALIQQKKDEKIAAVSADFDALLSAANSLEVDGDVDALNKQVADLSAANADLQAKLDALSAKEAVEADAIAKVKSDVASV